MKGEFSRIYILGQSGSGKTTLGRSISKKTGIEFIELDKIWFEHNKNRDTFTKYVQTNVISKKRWIVDGKYRTVREKLINKADIVIFLDIPFLFSLKKNLIREWKNEGRITISFLRHILKFTREFYPTRSEILKQVSRDSQKTVTLHNFKETDEFVEKLS